MSVCPVLSECCGLLVALLLDALLRYLEEASAIIVVYVVIVRELDEIVDWGGCCDVEVVHCWLWHQHQGFVELRGLDLLVLVIVEPSDETRVLSKHLLTELLQLALRIELALMEDDVASKVLVSRSLKKLCSLLHVLFHFNRHIYSCYS